MKRFFSVVEPQDVKPTKQLKMNPVPEDNRLILSPRSWMIQRLNVLESPDADFEAMKQSMWDVERKPYMLAGREVVSHRNQVFYSKDPNIKYNFTGAPSTTVTEYPALVQKCVEYAERHFPEFDWNGCLGNCYKDGNDWIGAHSDDERALNPGAPILSFSFGGLRKFVVNRIKKPGTMCIGMTRHVTWMPHNSLIIMGGDMQKEFKHQVPILNKKEAMDPKSTAPRINITVRSFKPSYPS